MEPRPIKELLQILLDNIDKLDTGLCWLTHCLWNDGVISLRDAIILSDYIDESAPEGIDPCTYFIGDSGDKEPRIEWLKRQIEKL